MSQLNIYEIFTYNRKCIKSKLKKRRREILGSVVDTQFFVNFRYTCYR